MILDAIAASILQGGIVPKGTRVQVFREIYWVFLGLGTLVGAVVIGYMLYNGYKYRYQGGEDKDGDRPKLGEVPTGGGKGKKLFTSLTLSAIIVISLIVWTYGTLLYVEAAPEQPDAGVDVEVEGYQFGWDFTYLNDAGESTGVETTGTLRVPVDTRINLQVTSRDVFHNFGIPELKIKSDAIPGEHTETWFEASQTGEYTAHCYELCGQGHSYMDATIIVMEQEEYEDWLENQQDQASNENSSAVAAGGA